MIAALGSHVGREELAEIADCLEQQWLGSGPKTATFETEFARRQGLPNLVVVNSGSNALYLAVTLLGLPPGSDIVVPSFTWVSCAHSILLAGHRPVFCDVDLHTHNVTAETIAAVMTPNTKAIMAVHYAGLPVPMASIAALGLPIIEDAAHAVDSRLDGHPCGGLGDVGVFSFDAVKNLAMGEGGAVTARDPALAERARRLRYCGIVKSGFDAAETGSARWWEHDITAVFPKMLASDLNAAVGLAQLRKLDALQSARRRIWDIYQEQFADLDWLCRPVDASHGDRHSYFTYVIRIPHRDRSAAVLYQQGIYTTLRYHPLHLSPIFGAGSPLANTERLGREALSLPLHPRLTDADVERVVTAVRALPESW
jgi:dTDP-4-amino-4,6-dideoxygalactose transaminase